MEPLLPGRISQAESRHSRPRETQSVPLDENRCRVLRKTRFTADLHGLYTVRFSKTGRTVAAGFETGIIQIRDGETGELTATLRSIFATGMPVMCCRFHPIHENIFYAASACGTIFMCNMHRELSRFISEPKNEVNTIDISITGDSMVSGGKDATVRLYDTRTAKLIVMFKKNEKELIEKKPINFHWMRIFASRFHKDHTNLIITGGWDDTVRIWDVRVPTGSVRVIRGPHICGDALDIRGTHILTGSWVVRDSLQLWDLTSAKLIETINPQNRVPSLNGEFLYVAQYFNGDPHGDLVLAGGSGTGAVEVISLRKKKVMGSFHVSKPVFTIDSFQTSIIFGGMETVITIGNYT